MPFAAPKTPLAPHDKITFAPKLITYLGIKQTWLEGAFNNQLGLINIMSNKA
jgi:hypothetical protein